MQTIHEILEGNIILASDEDLDCLVTLNGAYWHLYVGQGDGTTYQATEIQATDFGFDGLDSKDCPSLSKLMDKARDLLLEWTNPEDEDE